MHGKMYINELMVIISGWVLWMILSLCFLNFCKEHIVQPEKYFLTIHFIVYKVRATFIKKYRARRVAQVVKPLPTKCETLSSVKTRSCQKKKKKKGNLDIGAKDF
jgi:hypothetical protein